MLLSSSSAAVNETANVIDAVEGKGNDLNIPYAEELIAFTEAVHRLDGTLEEAREKLISAVGEKGMVDAAVIASIFRSLNIAADSSGIRIDDEWEAVAAHLATKTNANKFSTAANSPNITKHIDSMRRSDE